MKLLLLLTALAACGPSVDEAMLVANGAKPWRCSVSGRDQHTCVDSQNKIFVCGNHNGWSCIHTGFLPKEAP